MIDNLLNCKCVFSKGQHPVDVKLVFSFWFLYHAHKILRVMNVMGTFKKFLLILVFFFLEKVLNIVLALFRFFAV